MSRRYLAALAVAALLVLIVGASIRNRLLRADARAPAAPSEAAGLQQLSQEGQLRRIATYLQERSHAVSPLIEFLPSLGVAGIRWGAGDTVLTTLPGRPLIHVVVPRRDSVVPAFVLAPDSLRHGWALVVGRAGDGRVIVSPALTSGRSPLRCGQRQFEEVLLSVYLHDALAGAGVFDLAGRLLGVVVRCPTRMAAITATAVARASGDSAVLWERLGIRADSLDAEGRDYFGADSGALVAELRRNSPADLLGVRPGDVVIAAGSDAISSPADLRRLALSRALDTLQVTRRGQGTSTVVTLVPNDSPSQIAAQSTGIGVDVTSQAAFATGVIVTTVHPGSAAHTAGLQAGDRLLRIGDAAVTSAATARRLLSARRRGTTFLVFERDSVARGVLLPR